MFYIKVSLFCCKSYFLYDSLVVLSYKNNQGKNYLLRNLIVWHTKAETMHHLMSAQ